MEDDAVVGRLTREYNENEEAIDRASKALRDLGMGFSELGQTLTSRSGYEWDPQVVKRLRVVDGVLGVGQYSRAAGLPFDAVERAAELVTTLSAALEKKKELEESLRRNGLERIIRPLRR